MGRRQWHWFDGIQEELAAFNYSSLLLLTWSVAACL
jgi:hypothetical protein